jgi:hypothetical protein
MPTKQREGARHDFGWFSYINPHPGISAFCGGDFRGIWFSGQASTERPSKIHSVVVFSFSRGRNWNRLGDVPFFSLIGSTDAQSR